MTSKVMHVCAATWTPTEGAKPINGIAILKEAGLCDVTHFISPEGVYQGPVWTYDLHPYQGAQTFFL